MSAPPITATRKPARKSSDRLPSETTPPAPNYVSVAYGADYAGISQKTLRRWIAAGDLPAYRLGKRLVRIDLADLDKLIHRIPAARMAG